MIKRADKRLGQDEKNSNHLFQNLVNCDVDCVACGLKQINK